MADLMICDPDQLRSIAREVTPLAVEARRHIHENPELGHLEFETTAYLSERLTAEGIHVEPLSVGTGLVATVGEGEPTVGFRADIDALPIDEKTDVPFASKRPGLMHACGHDVHSSVALGIAIVLQRFGAFTGSVRFVFQPAEEQFPGGAQELVDARVIDGLQSIIAFHVDPHLEVGKIGFRSGPITAASDRFTVSVQGPGGHTARPHESVDTVMAAGRIAADLPELVSRRVDPRSPTVVVFGRIHGGEVENVIPTQVDLSGTARTLDKDIWMRLPKLVEELAGQIVMPTGASVHVDYVTGTAPVVNDQRIVSEAEFAVAQVLGPGAVVGTQPSMGAEDFSAYLLKIPGALFRLGSRGAGMPIVDLHTATFNVDEQAIPTGVLGGAAALLGSLNCAF